ncbi:vacuolar protein sorting-associated protein 26C-like isoform X2 [Ptychodera flava]|uniref:vacuolar protein sorting-associated protein 26C-like isoform X2 n=1 Tax=Ptychodera flava TaxID=63121 RepID=UPI003969EEBF
MATTLDIRLKKANKIYHEGELVQGVLLINCKSDFQHQGITLTMEGSVNLQLSAKSVGLFEAFYNSIKPIQILHYSVEVSKPGRLPAGRTEMPFELPLKPKGNKTLFETYHGVFVNIQYTVKVEMKRSVLSKDLSKSSEFIVEYKQKSEQSVVKPVPFTITPESLQNIRERSGLPKFVVRGKMDSVNCCISKPLTGEIIVEQCAAPIKSIELQLVRVETCGCAEGYAKDATEIQNIQIAEGDVCRGFTIPIFMIFPRLFTCPTLATSNFKVVNRMKILIKITS